MPIASFKRQPFNPVIKVTLRKKKDVFMLLYGTYTFNNNYKPTFMPKLTPQNERFRQNASL